MVRLAMGDDNKKSFWTSLPGILTGVAAVIVAVGGILAAYNHVVPSPPPSTAPSSSPATSPQPSSPASSSSSPAQQIGCGTHPPRVMLFGSWRWSGTVDGTPESGSFTFNNDCTYVAKVTKSGFTTNDEGKFLVSSSPDASITLTNKNSGQKHTYIISKPSENSFHASSPDYTVNLDFFRA
jgi:hypothetical protein